jgi:hypothetical protein
MSTQPSYSTTLPWVAVELCLLGLESGLGRERWSG